jgi:hypothetical protein
MSQAKEGEIYDWIRDRAMASLSARAAGEKEREKFHQMFTDACNVLVPGSSQYVACSRRPPFPF